VQSAKEDVRRRLDFGGERRPDAVSGVSRPPACDVPRRPAVRELRLVSDISRPQAEEGGAVMAFSDDGTMEFARRIAPLADGARVRVLEQMCSLCGIVWPFGEGVTYTVAAAVLREIATQWHLDDCPGPMLFVTEPAVRS